MNKDVPKLEQIALRSLMTHGLFNIRDTRLTASLRQKLYLQAVIDDHKDIVARILESEPRRVATSIIKASTITSLYTWQTFEADFSLTMAVMLGQIEMVKLLIDALNKLPQTPRIRQIKENGLAIWSQEKKFEHQIVIPSQYTRPVEALIQRFIAEPFPYRTSGCWSHFCVTTERALAVLFKMLIPTAPITLKSYMKPELFLLALYRAYFSHFDEFKNMKQRDAFCVHVIGLVQSTLAPETAKAFCQGLFYVIEKKQTIGPRAEALKLLDEQSGERDFYRPFLYSRSSHLCGMIGYKREGLRKKTPAEGNVLFMQHYYLQKEQEFIKVIKEDDEHYPKIHSDLIEEQTMSASSSMN